MSLFLHSKKDSFRYQIYLFNPHPHRSQVHTVIVNKAVLLAPDLCFAAPSQNSRLSGISQVHSLLQWRDRVGFTPIFPIKSCDTLSNRYKIYTEISTKYSSVFIISLILSPSKPLQSIFSIFLHKNTCIEILRHFSMQANFYDII